MYVNSGNYPPPSMVSNGTFGHQVGHNGTSPAPPGTYMTPALVPNLVFRQNVPVRLGTIALNRIVCILKATRESLNYSVTFYPIETCLTRVTVVAGKWS